jgi:hypothetical protein
MDSNNLYFGSRLVKAIKLGFLVHDLAVFRKKKKTIQLRKFLLSNSGSVNFCFQLLKTETLKKLSSSFQLL